MAIAESEIEKSRSPLKERPLRHAGQSINEHLLDRLLDTGGFILAGWTMLVMAGMEWFRVLGHDSFHSYFLTVLALIVCTFCGWKFFKILKEIKPLKLGRDGERIVSEILDQLRKGGYEILHDVVGGDFNVDHVLISEVVREINQVTRGWSNYFALAHHHRSFKQLNYFIAHRLRQWLWRKHGNPSGKYTRWPTSALFQTYGLYQMPTNLD